MYLDKLHLGFLLSRCWFNSGKDFLWREDCVEACSTAIRAILWERLVLFCEYEGTLCWFILIHICDQPFSFIRIAWPQRPILWQKKWPIWWSQRLWQRLGERSVQGEATSGLWERPIWKGPFLTRRTVSTSRPYCCILFHSCICYEFYAYYAHII